MDAEEAHIDTKKTGIIGLAILPALAAFGLLGLACPNRAAEGDSQKPPLKSGAQLWAENCSTCHEVEPRVNFSQEKSDAIKRHMREEADLSPVEQEAVLGFLKSIQ